jgi:hypothetical protein
MRFKQVNIQLSMGNPEAQATFGKRHRKKTNKANKVKNTTQKTKKNTKGTLIPFGIRSIQQWKTILREKRRVACLTLEPGKDRKIFFS